MKVPTPVQAMEYMVEAPQRTMLPKYGLHVEVDSVRQVQPATPSVYTTTGWKAQRADTDNEDGVCTGTLRKPACIREGHVCSQ